MPITSSWNFQERSSLCLPLSTLDDKCLPSEIHPVHSREEVSWHSPSKIMLFFLQTWQGDRQWTDCETSLVLQEQSYQQTDHSWKHSSINISWRHTRQEDRESLQEEQENKSDTEGLAWDITHENNVTDTYTLMRRRIKVRTFLRRLH